MASNNVEMAKTSMRTHTVVASLILSRVYNVIDDRSEPYYSMARLSRAYLALARLSCNVVLWQIFHNTTHCKKPSCR